MVAITNCRSRRRRRKNRRRILRSTSEHDEARQEEEDDQPGRPIAVRDRSPLDGGQRVVGADDGGDARETVADAARALDVTPQRDEFRARRRIEHTAPSLT